MTFKTTEQNTFKKANLNGLEYKQTEYRKVKAVEWWFAAIVAMLIILCIKDCNSDKVALTYQQLAQQP